MSVLFLLVGCGTFYDGMMTQCHYVVIDGTEENGTSKMVYKDGWTFAEGKIKNNEKDGWWTYYRRDGTIYTKWLFDNGETEGHFEQYYENGQLACKGFNKFIPPDYKSTSMEFYSPDGKSISEDEFHKKKYGNLIDRWLDDLWEEKYGSFLKRVGNNEYSHIVKYIIFHHSNKFNIINNGETE